METVPWVGSKQTSGDGLDISAEKKGIERVKGTNLTNTMVDRSLEISAKSISSSESGMISRPPDRRANFRILLCGSDSSMIF